MSSIRSKSKGFAADVLSKSFKPEKCKTSLKLAVARMKLLRNKREAQVKHMRRDLAQLLESGQEQTARIRVEHVIREEKTMSAYELIELYCELIVARLPIIASQKNCPIDLKEAIASVIFASPRCADLPELMDVRKHFTAKYGKEFINSALEVRPDCGVSRMVVEKLSARAPDVETKIKVLTVIAKEHNIKWDSEAFQEQLQKPKEDLLDGPDTFASANKIPKEASNNMFPPEPSQKNVAANKKFENDVLKPSSFNASYANANTQRSSLSELGSSENSEVKYSYSADENASLNRSNWKMEFKDATSAAQAAAESAEMASLAARAAAELASHGNASRKYRTGSRESPTYHRRDQGQTKSMGSKPEVEHVGEDPVVMEGDELKNTQDIKGGTQDLWKDELNRGTSKPVPESTNNVQANVRSRSSSRSSSLSSEASIHDDISQANPRKSDEMAYGRAQNFSTENHMEWTTTSKKYENDEFDQRSTNENYSKPVSYYSESKFDEDTIGDPTLPKSEDVDGQSPATGAGGRSSAGSHDEPAFDGGYAAVFDDYGSDTDDQLMVGRYNEGNLFDSFRSRQGNEPSMLASSVNPWSPKHRSESLKKVKSSGLPLATETNQMQHRETIEEIAHPSHDHQPVAFDDSDGLDSEGEDEMNEATEPNNLLHNQRSLPSGSLSSADSGRRSTSSFLNEKKENEEANRGSPPVFSNAHRGNFNAGLNYGGRSWERSGSSGLTDNQPSPRNEGTTRNSSSSGRGLLHHPQDDESPTPDTLKVSSMLEADTKDKFEQPLSPSGIKDSEPWNGSSYESGQGLDFGRLTGGFKNRGFPRPRYIRSPLVDASSTSIQKLDDAPSITEKPFASHLDKSAANSELPDEEEYDQESTSKSYLSSRRSSRAYIVSKVDQAEGSVSHHAIGGRGYRSEASFSSNKDAEGTLGVTRNLSVPQEDRFSGNRNVSVQEPSSQRSHGKDNTQLSSQTSAIFSDAGSNEQPGYAGESRRRRNSASTSPLEGENSSPTIEKSTISHQSKMSASSEVSKQDMYDTTLRTKAYNELSSKMQAAYFDKESDEEEELKSSHTTGNRGSRDVKLSRRTRGLPLETKKGHLSGLADQSNVPSVSELESKHSQSSSSVFKSLSKTRPQAMDFEGEESSNPSQRMLSAERPSVMLSKTESPKLSHIQTKKTLPLTSESPKTSNPSGRLTSRESSFKSASHVHPKLPDYDALAAHFQALRSNRRTE